MVTASLALAALVTASSAFVVTPFSAGPHAIGYRAQLSTRVGCSKTRQSSSTVPIPDEEGNVLPPRDETFGPLAVIREALAAPGLPEGAKRFDRIGRETGGIWRSRILGFLPATVPRMKAITDGCPSTVYMIECTYFCNDRPVTYNILRGYDSSRVTGRPHHDKFRRCLSTKELAFASWVTLDTFSTRDSPRGVLVNLKCKIEIEKTEIEKIKNTENVGLSWFIILMDGVREATSTISKMLLLERVTIHPWHRAKSPYDRLLPNSTRSWGRWRMYTVLRTVIPRRCRPHAVHATPSDFCFVSTCYCNGQIKLE